MILDVKFKDIDGKKILCKYGPNPENVDNFYTVDDHGYISFDYNKFSWQPVNIDQ